MNMILNINCFDKGLLFGIFITLCGIIMVLILNKINGE